MQRAITSVSYTHLDVYKRQGLMRALTGLNLEGASDFRLLDRRVVDTLLAFPEKVRFFRGMTVWTGFKTVPVSCLLYTSRCV